MKAKLVEGIASVSFRRYLIIDVDCPVAEKNQKSCKLHKFFEIRTKVLQQAVDNVSIEHYRLFTVTFTLESGHAHQA
jgi:hypothetical protein